MKKRLLSFAIFSFFTPQLFAQAAVCIPPIGLDCVTAPKYIDSVFTTNAIVNFSNLGTNCNTQDQNYADYPNKIASESAGGSFTVHIGVNVVAVVYIGVWIDWNNDLVFGNGEQVYLSSGIPTSVNVTVNVPPTATLDTLVFRIRSGTTLPGACDSIDAGETEDYRLIVLDPNGINSFLTNDSWKIFPNPANDFLNVDLGENLGETEISIIDLLGNIVSFEIIDNGKGVVDLSALPHGMYFVRINSGGEDGLKRFVH